MVGFAKLSTSLSFLLLLFILVADATDENLISSKCHRVAASADTLCHDLGTEDIACIHARRSLTAKCHQVTSLQKENTLSSKTHPLQFPKLGEAVTDKWWWGGGSNKAHIGLRDPLWTWSPDHWRQQKQSGVECNPAACHNPASCGIPDCTLVSYEEYYGYGNHGIRDNWHGVKNCDTLDKQLDEGSNGCVPSSVRHTWPSHITDEGDACRYVLGKSNTGASRLLMGWAMQPSARIVFCSHSVYSTGFAELVPRASQGVGDNKNGDWLFGGAGWDQGSWSMNMRTFLAWPFDSFDVHGTSTKNIVLRIFKRAVCRSSGTGSTDCYNFKEVKCFVLTSNCMSARYASHIGSSHLKCASNSLGDFCGATLANKIKSYITGYAAGA